MILSIVFITILYIVFISADLNINPLSDDYINYINSKQSSWKAGRNFDPNTSLHELRVRAGVLKQSVKQPNQIQNIHFIQEDDVITAEFDARKVWSQCESIGKIVDQASCGSCWAVSASQAISDRICIHSKGTLQPRISAMNLMSCCGGRCGMGCGGGLPNLSFNYWVETGIVSGGPYNTTNWCQAYPFPPCEHYNSSGNLPACSDDIPMTPDCLNICDEESTLTYNEDFYFGESSYDVANDTQQIQLEILKNGPVVAIMHMYYDWFSYKSGVFIPISTDPENWAGEHAVRILGWGIENGVPYWLVANSFNEDWGDQGFFKIRRGTNECGIEERVVAGLPKL